MRDLIQLLPVLIVILAVVSVIRNAAKMVRKAGEQRPAAQSRSPADYDPAWAERTRRIQEEIRRKIAERRGQTVAPEAAPVGPGMEPPVIYVEERVIPPVMESSSAVLERQQQLADQMRALELARATQQRHAAQLSAEIKSESASSAGLLTAARAGLMTDLRDPAGLRRAFMLREVLGPPVGLR